MGFTIKNNVINVDRNGMKVNDSPMLAFATRFIEGQELEWKEALLRIYDLGKIKEFKVYLHNGVKIWLKPREKVECAVFEEIFGFSSKCQDYDENKIVCIKN